MFQTRVLSKELDGRLDSEFYEPDRYSKELKVVQSAIPHAPLGSFAEPGTSITYGIVQPGTFVAPGNGVRMIRCVDISGLSVRAAEVLWVSGEIAAPYARSEVKPRDVLIGIAGTLGCIAVAPFGIEPANLNQSVARLRANLTAGEDPEWFAAFLASSYGQAILLRRSVGSVQQHLNLADLPSVPILHPSPIARGYIGDKVRQAEQLRNMSAVSMAAALTLLDELVMKRVSERDVAEILPGPGTCIQSTSKMIHELVAKSRPTRAFTTQRRSARIATGTLSNRLDASYYSEEALSNARMLDALGARELRSMISSTMSGYGVLPDSNEYLAAGISGVPLIRGGDLAYGAINPPEVFVPKSYAFEPDLTSEDDVLLLIKGACIDSPAGVGLVQAKEVNRLFNGSCFRLRATSVDPAYLVAYFQTESFLIQKRREIANTGISYNSEESISRFLIPRFGDPVERLIAQLVRKSLATKELSTSLIVAATCLVEALIESKITERHCENAQQSILRGDLSLDQAILSRLTEGGIDVTGMPPLFSDLNVLFATIEELRNDSGNGGAA